MTDLYQTIEGEPSGEGLNVAVVASRFNDEIVTGLLDGAVDCLTRHGVAPDKIVVIRVPGAFEVPQAVKRAAATQRFDAIVSLGALIRGDTPHFEYISAQVTTELSHIATSGNLPPVSFGVITCNTLEQAQARTRKGSNKGWEAALAALEMANLYRKLDDLE